MAREAPALPLATPSIVWFSAAAVLLPGPGLDTGPGRSQPGHATANLLPHDTSLLLAPARPRSRRTSRAAAPRAGCSAAGLSHELGLVPWAGGAEQGRGGGLSPAPLPAGRSGAAGGTSRAGRAGRARSTARSSGARDHPGCSGLLSSARSTNEGPQRADNPLIPAAQPATVASVGTAQMASLSDNVNCNMSWRHHRAAAGLSPRGGLLGCGQLCVPLPLV